jgi:hypothetical protein
MRIRSRLPKRSRRGVALVYAVFGAFVAASAIAVLTTVSLVGDKDAGRKRTRVQGEYLADGAVEAAKKRIQQAIANFAAPPPTGTATIDGSQVSYAITLRDDLHQPPGAEDYVVTDPAGIQTTISNYEINARAAVGGARVTAHRVIRAEATPVFQFAVFYTDDLEINPGADMTIKGRIHTNGDVYLNSTNTLTCDTNYLRALGGIYRHRKDDPTLSQGTVQVRQWVVNPFDPAEPSSFFRMNSLSQMTSLGVATTSGYDSDFVTGWDDDLDGSFYGADDWLPFGPGALEYWGPPTGYTDGTGYTVLAGEHGVTEAVTPYIGSIRMFEETAGGSHYWDGAEYVPALVPGTGTHSPGYYHSQADLSIIVQDDGSWDAFDASGTNVTLALQGCGVVTVADIYDARQANDGPGDTPVAEIDIAALNGCSAWPANGLVYAAHYGAGTGTDAKGILLKNGAELHAKLTVVSEDPIYIKGDYNTVNKKGASVIGDAINLLSNAWNGSKTHNTLPAATNTAYNVAMISGNQDSSVGAYNGGLDNLPRFHENWTGKTCEISGSFVNTWNSQYATAAWVYGGKRYTAPRRIWQYDPAFNSVANLPPFTPMAVSAVDVATW